VQCTGRNNSGAFSFLLSFYFLMILLFSLTGQSKRNYFVLSVFLMGYFQIVHYFPDIFALIYLLLNSSTPMYLIPCTYLAIDEIIWLLFPALVSWSALCLDTNLRFIVNFALQRKHISSPLQRLLNESVCYIYFCYDFNRNRYVLTNFRKTTKKETLRTLTMGVALFYKEGRTDGQSWRG
jgi:hypothetical protein